MQQERYLCPHKVIGELAMILTVTSILKKRIRLTETQWRHIQNEHPELNDQQNKIKETLEQPDFVVESVRDETYHYVRHYGKTPVSEKRLLLVVNISMAKGL